MIAVPIVGLILYVTISVYARVESDGRHRAGEIALAVADAESDIVERARHLMIALSEIPVVREGRHTECARLFARLLDEYKVYAALGVADAEGTIVCSAPVASAGRSLGDRPIFQRMTNERQFLVGEYAVGRLSGKPSLGLAYPIIGASGEFRGMIFGALDLTWLPKLLGHVRGILESTVTLVDRNGIIFLRLPDDGRSLGRDIRNAASVRALGNQALFAGRMQDLDGRRRVTAVAPLRSAPGALIVVTLDDSAVYGAVLPRLVRGLGMIVVMLVLVLAAAWIGAASLLVRPIRRLMETARTLARGDLGARVGKAKGGSELAELAAAFDEMASALESRARQAELAERRYRGLFERNLAGIFRTHQGRVLECNLAFARVFGYDSPEEIMERSTADLYADRGQREQLLHDLAEGRPVTREIRGRRKDGSDVWLLVQIVEVATGTATYREGMVIDITERRRTEAAMREAAALREVTALANAAAHEINNPLAVVLGHLDLMARTQAADPTRMDEIRAGAWKIADIVARMRRITRLHPSDLPPASVPMLDIRRSSDP